MTNAEKYAEQLAQLIDLDTGENVCFVFGAGGLCGMCPLKGVCNNVKKLEEWLKQEAQGNGY
jgi:hypothetical protein